MLTGIEYSSYNITIFKKKLSGIIILNYLILIVVIIFFVKSLNHYELLVNQDNSNFVTWNWQL